MWRKSVMKLKNIRCEQREERMPRIRLLRAKRAPFELLKITFNFCTWKNVRESHTRTPYAPFLAEQRQFSPKWLNQYNFHQQFSLSLFSRRPTPVRSDGLDTRVYFRFKRFLFWKYTENVLYAAPGVFQARECSHEIFRKIFKLIKSEIVRRLTLFGERKNDDIVHMNFMSGRVKWR